MAQRVEVQLVDDLDGGEAAETVEFGVDGVGYEIDLSGRNAQALRDELAAYVGHGRRVGGRARRGRATARTTAAAPTATVAAPGAVDTATVRAWAHENGHQVSDRGRIAAGVLAAYHAAH